jgi:hypothetical protein
MNELPDQDLRDRFATLRREDAADAPSFQMARAAARSRPAVHWSRSPILAVAAVVLLVVTAFVILRQRAPRQPLVSLSEARWQSPTDFLLQVPGAKYLTTVPKLTYRVDIPEWRNP